MPNTPSTKKVILVAGPTAVGKTAVAIEIARSFNTEIISADSRQCYRELNIGVARPSIEELNTVPHHFIATHSIHEQINAAGFESYALLKAGELFTRHDVIVMAGGTGLYIKAFLEGLDPVPQIDPLVRDSIRSGYQTHGFTWLNDELQLSDPLFASTGEMLNPQRMMRALEVIRSTGRSIISYQSGPHKHRDFDVIKIGLELPRVQLNDRINKRVIQMMAHGQLDEAKDLLPWRDLNALRTVGYAEMFDHLLGHTTLAQATDLVAIHTRQYAKRQMTWFRKDEGYQWFGPSAQSAILDHIKNSLHQ